jgi:peptide deformylase
VTIKAYDAISEKEVTLRLSGYPAMVFQHEYDHLDGVLYYDRIDKKEPFREDPEAVRIE